MAGISSKALNGAVENKKKYNGIDWENEFDIAVYDAYYRELDPQTGRWWQIDPKIENMEAWSPYASNFDNPITYSDPLGDEPEGDDPPKRGFLSKAADVAITGVNWINENINPLTPIVEAVTGKAFNGGNFDVDKSRLTSIAEAGILLIPGGKIEGAVIKQLDKVIVKEGAETAEKQLVKYEVGSADNLLKRSVKGDNLDVHHVSLSKPASQIISGYDKKTAPAIALPRVEHKAIQPLKGLNTAGNARQQLAKDIRDLRKNTNAPNSSLGNLIDLNKKMSPDAFLKNK